MVKPILAVCAVGGFVWFIITVTHNATPGDISTVEAPLAVLFAWVLSTHAFDVPARRDVAYSLAGSAALMAVAAAQSVDLSLGVYVVAWVACGVWGLVAMWQSMAGTRGVPWLALVAAGVAGGGAGRAARGRAPGPEVSTSLIFPSSSGRLVAGGQPHQPHRRAPSLPAHAASPGGPHRGGRLPRLRQVPRHRRPGRPGQRGGHAGPGHAAQLLGRPDLRHLERPELDAGGQPGQRPERRRAG